MTWREEIRSRQGGLVWLSWKGVLSCLRIPLCLLGKILLGKVLLYFALVLKIYEEEDDKCIVLKCWPYADEREGYSLYKGREQ